MRRADSRIVSVRVVLAFGLLVSLGAPAPTAAKSRLQIEIGEFRQVEHREDGTRAFVLTGVRALVRGARVRIQEVDLQLFDAAGRVLLQAQTPRCFFNRENGVGRGDGPIRGRWGALTLAGVGYVVHSQEQTLSIHSQVRMSLRRAIAANQATEDEE